MSGASSPFRTTCAVLTATGRVRPRPSSSLSDIDSDSPDTPPQAGTWLLDTSAGKISLSDKHPIIERRGTGTAESVNGSEGYEFKVDQVFPPSSDTESLYAERVSPVVRSAMDGFNGTVFAYGQTGSGKTWTMMGNPDTPGVIPRAVEEIFEVIRAEDDSREFLLRVSYLEIYNESLRDLLEPEGTAKLDIRIDKGRVQVSGLKEEVVTHPAQVLDTIAKGEKARHVGATDWNERSSRSHTIFSMARPLLLFSFNRRSRWSSRPLSRGNARRRPTWRRSPPRPRASRRRPRSRTWHRRPSSARASRRST